MLQNPFFAVFSLSSEHVLSVCCVSGFVSVCLNLRRPVRCRGAYLPTVPVIAFSPGCIPEPFGLYWGLNNQVTSRFKRISGTTIVSTLNKATHSPCSLILYRAVWLKVHHASESHYFNWHPAIFKFRPRRSRSLVFVTFLRWILPFLYSFSHAILQNVHNFLYGDFGAVSY